MLSLSSWNCIQIFLVAGFSKARQTTLPATIHPQVGFPPTTSSDQNQNRQICIFSFKGNHAQGPTDCRAEGLNGKKKIIWWSVKRTQQPSVHVIHNNNAQNIYMWWACRSFCLPNCSFNSLFITPTIWGLVVHRSTCVLLDKLEGHYVMVMSLFKSPSGNIFHILADFI